MTTVTARLLRTASTKVSTSICEGHTTRERPSSQSDDRARSPDGRCRGRPPGPKSGGAVEVGCNFFGQVPYPENFPENGQWTPVSGSSRPSPGEYAASVPGVIPPIPPMRVDRTASGACSSGSTAHPRGATRRAPGGAATTSTRRAERSRGCRGATAGLEISRRMASERASQQAFLGVSALLFAASAAVTIVWCASMSAMGEMPMPGRWTMPMAWMRMPGQTWPGAAASFLGMWVVMMVAMMLPSP
jgi:hypothetical protein